MYKPLALLTALYIAAVPYEAEARERNLSYSPIYTVRRGDTLRSISRATGIDKQEIKACNPDLKIKKRNKIRLYNQHTVKTGDSLSEIAWQYNSTLAEVVDYNPNIRRINVIYPGQKLAVPCREERTEPRIYDSNESHEEGNGNDNEKVIREEKKPSKPGKEVKTIKYPSGLELTIVNDSALIGKDGYFRDPKNGGIPLVKIPYDKLFERVSNHFTLAEFIRIEEKEEGDCAVGNTVNNTYQKNGNFYFMYARLDPKLVNLIEKIRTKYGKPIFIEEGYRPLEYNKCVGGVPGRHPLGKAIDVSVIGATSYYPKKERNKPNSKSKCKRGDIVSTNGVNCFKPTPFYNIASSLMKGKGARGFAKSSTHLDVFDRYQVYKYPGLSRVRR